MGSFNSCAKTNTPSSCSSTVVSKEELNNVLLTGFRFIDFEIYSIKGNIVVGIGGVRYQYTKCPTHSGNEHILNPLKDNGTYGITDHPKFPFIPIKEALEVVKTAGFSQAGNKNEPLFILFRIKSFDSKIYIALETAIKNILGQYLLPKNYGRDGKLISGTNNRSIIKLPLYALKRKAIICVEDHCKLYEQPEAKGCYDLINMVAGGQYLKTYTHQEILDADRMELRREAHNRLIVGYPEYTSNDSLKQAYDTMHTKGVQVAMVRYRTIICDQNQNYVEKLLGSEAQVGYIDYFATTGAFKIKPKEHQKQPDVVSKDIQSRTPKEQSLTATTSHTDALGNTQKIRGAGR